LIPFEVDLVTAITIVLIGTILTIYLLILKKNGWIGETSNYRCPNPQCRKIFQAPLKVKDFSTGKEVGFACPECGYDLGFLNGGKGLKETALQNGEELKIKDSVSKPIEARGLMANGGFKEPKASVVIHPTVELEKKPSLPKSNQTLLKQNLDDSKEDNPSCCKHYFGYLRALPTQTENLDECFFCPMLLECGKRGSTKFK